VGLLGTALLSLPICSKSMSHVSLVDNLFSAFSAVCVTGLATVSIADTYSLPGQVVVLALIQAGGLGIMVLSAAVAIMAGQRLGLKSSAMLTEVVDGASLATLRRSVLTICALTLVFEALGAWRSMCSGPSTRRSCRPADTPWQARVICGGRPFFTP
jgi:trk system potassium uptake protein